MDGNIRTLVCFLALGDWGEKSAFRDQILVQITSHLDEINFIIALGDNFYEVVIYCIEISMMIVVLPLIEMVFAYLK